jgi:hypothetical protein
MEDRCIVCNEIIPEGRMVCPFCESQQIKLGRILQSHQATNEEINKVYAFMEGSDDD